MIVCKKGLSLLDSLKPHNIIGVGCQPYFLTQIACENKFTGMFLSL
jgi:hypothetical protein